MLVERCDLAILKTIIIIIIIYALVVKSEDIHEKTQNQFVPYYYSFSGNAQLLSDVRKTLVGTR